MKNLDLASFGVVEMNEAEMLTVEGGNIFEAVGNAIAKAAETVVKIAVDVAETVAETASSLNLVLNDTVAKKGKP